MGKYITTCLGMSADFSGRASRAEFWWWQLFAIVIIAIVCVAAMFVNSLLTTNSSLTEDLYSAIIPVSVTMLILAPISLSVAIRRLHDVGRDVPSLLLLIIPIIGWIILLIILTQPSKEDK